MKKLRLIIVLCLVILLGSCLGNDAKTEELIYKYNQYLDTDISHETNFDNLINDISNDVMHGLVLIKVTIRTPLGFLVEQRFGTGFIIDKKNTNVTIISAYNLIHLENQNHRLRLDVYDFQGNEYTASISKSSSTTGLFILSASFSNLHDQTKIMTLSETFSLANEPVFMLSHLQRFRNSLTMGLIQSYEMDTLTTTLSLDNYSLGAVLVNSLGEVIGIAAEINQSDTIIYNAAYIKSYILETTN